FVREQDAAGAREGEAVAEEEGADAVRLLTIHAAKGLEFKVVVVADAGRDRAASHGEEILCLPDGRFGFKVADPSTGRRKGAFDGDAPAELERGGARLLLRVDRYRPPQAQPEPEPEEAPQLSLFSAEEVPVLPPIAPELPPLAPIPEPAFRVRSLSYSALALFERCSYRFYAERFAGLRPVDESRRIPGQTGL